MNNAHETIYPKNILDKVLVQPQGVLGVDPLTEVVLEAGPMLYELARAVFSVISQRTHKPLTFIDRGWSLKKADPQERELTEEDLINVFRLSLYARIAQVNQGLKLDGSPRDFEYPSVLGPILGAIGKFEDPQKNLVIEPKLPGSASEFVVNARLKIPENYSRVVFLLRTVGLQTNFGLPVDRTTQNPSFYQLALSDDEAIIGVTNDASPDMVLVSTLVHMSALVDLFGQYRVLYGAVTQVRSAIQDIALASVHFAGSQRNS